MKQRGSAVWFSTFSENCRRFVLHPVGAPGILVTEKQLPSNNQKKEIAKRSNQTYTHNAVTHIVCMSTKNNRSSRPCSATWRQRCTLTNSLHSKSERMRTARVTSAVCFFKILFSTCITKVTGVIECDRLGDIDYFLQTSFLHRKFVTECSGSRLTTLSKNPERELGQKS